MPRIRTLKPEHRQHRKIGPLTDRQYRLWVGMLCDADDHGRLVAEPEQLRVTIWGYHRRVTAAHVADDLGRLHDAGLVILYRAEGVLYAAFPSWKDHQKVDHPTDSRLPEPPHEPSREFASVRGGSDRKDQGSDRRGSEGASLFATPPESSTNGHVVFKIPAPIAAALDRCPKLGEVSVIRQPSYWQAEIRANPGVQFAGELLKAEAYLKAHPEKHYKKLGGFLHGWLGRADREQA